MRPPPTLPPIIIHSLYLQRKSSQLSSIGSVMSVVFYLGGISIEPSSIGCVGAGGTGASVFKSIYGLKIKA